MKIMMKIGVYEEKQGKQNNYVAVRQERRDGTFRTVLLPKVMFTNPKIDGETAEKDRSQVKRLKVRRFSFHSIIKSQYVSISLIQLT